VENLMTTIHLKRAYEEPSRSDGLRILVERLWPRGLSKERAAVDVWLKDIAPSPGLRRWFGHDPAKWEEFQKRYWTELEANPDAVTDLRRRIREGPVTFVYAARDEQHNGALALKEYLRRHPS
jgi:uncharacterized protein YeaO (DUF488 family)